MELVRTLDSRHRAPEISPADYQAQLYQLEGVWSSQMGVLLRKMSVTAGNLTEHRSSHSPAQVLSVLGALGALGCPQGFLLK